METLINLDLLKKQFDQDMLQIYHLAKKAGYTASKFFQMVKGNGGFNTAQNLIHETKHSEGFTKLLILGKLELSVEVLVLNKKYKHLFTDVDRAICRKKLEQCQFFRFDDLGFYKEN